jgi:hypothetical protein
MCVYSPYSICFPPIKIVDDDNCRNKVSTQNFSTVFTFEAFQITMRPRRISTTLSDAVKYDIIQMRDKGTHRYVILKKYGIALSTLRNIEAQRGEIIRRYETNIVTPTRTSRCMSCRKMKDLEGILYHWFIQCKKHRIKITGLHIKEKAHEINEKLNLHPNFNADRDWVRKFRIRYCVTENDIHLDFPKRTFAAAAKFTTEFRKLLRGCTWENVYNVAYVPMMWKSVPEKTEIIKCAKSTGNQEMSEDHITVLICVNASGCHKLPILIIGSEEINRSLCNFETSTMSTIYKSKSHAWMDSTIFNEWFVQHFLKSVREKQKMGRRQKTVLLLDNTSLLFDLDYLNKKDEFVTVKSIPNNVTPRMLPMSNGIFLCFIRKYRGELVKTLKSFHMCKTTEEVIYNHKHLSMWDCCRIVHTAWPNVDAVVIRRAWNTFLTGRKQIYETKAVRHDVRITYKKLRKVPGCKSSNRRDVQKWFEVDKIDKIVMKVYTDEAIRDFESNTMGVDIVDNVEAGPSHS